jgi:hypothetical protein
MAFAVERKILSKMITSRRSIRAWQLDWVALSADLLALWRSFCTLLLLSEHYLLPYFDYLLLNAFAILES